MLPLALSRRAGSRVPGYGGAAVVDRLGGTTINVVNFMDGIDGLLGRRFSCSYHLLCWLRLTVRLFICVALVRARLFWWELVTC